MGEEVGSRVELREVREEDLRALFEHQPDAVAADGPQARRHELPGGEHGRPRARSGTWDPRCRTHCRGT